MDSKLLPAWQGAPPTENADEFPGFFALAGVGNAVVDVRTRRFVRVNRRFEEITGYSSEELRDLTFEEITHPDDRGLDAAGFHELITGARDVVKLEKRYVRKDGESVWIHLTTTLVRGPAGTPDLQLGVVADITARKRAEAELEKLHHDLQRLVDERTRALSEKSTQLESFVYTVAHDLRAPLRAINGYAEFVTEDASTSLSGRSASYLDHIKQAARRMDGLIRDLLSYTRVIQVEVNFERVPLADCVDWAIAELDQVIESRAAEVKIASPLQVVCGERGALEQVVAHLLSNALKFVPKGRHPAVRVHCETRGDFVRFCVTDNGIGIRPEYHERVFRIFERLDDARSYPGTGVGLPIVRKTIERLGGKVGLQSKPGIGSTFWFELRKAAP